MPVDKLHVTVLKSDHEALRLRKQISGFFIDKNLERDEHDNFWTMGESGPCGPCSEVYWDLGDHIAEAAERFLELWKLVFMQFIHNEGECKQQALPRTSVDTGMGLERMASVLQKSLPTTTRTFSCLCFTRQPL